MAQGGSLKMLSVLLSHMADFRKNFTQVLASTAQGRGQNGQLCKLLGLPFSFIFTVMFGSSVAGDFLYVSTNHMYRPNPTMN